MSGILNKPRFLDRQFEGIVSGNRDWGRCIGCDQHTC